VTDNIASGIAPCCFGGSITRLKNLDAVVRRRLNAAGANTLVAGGVSPILPSMKTKRLVGPKIVLTVVVVAGDRVEFEMASPAGVVSIAYRVLPF
jgi:hypothetical protein